jgi:hypothetical protein
MLRVLQRLRAPTAFRAMRSPVQCRALASRMPPAPPSPPAPAVVEPESVPLNMFQKLSVMVLAGVTFASVSFVCVDLYFRYTNAKEVRACLHGVACVWCCCLVGLFLLTCSCFCCLSECGAEECLSSANASRTLQQQQKRLSNLPHLPRDGCLHYFLCWNQLDILVTHSFIHSGPSII